MIRTDAAAIKLLAREGVGSLQYALNAALEFNKKSTADVSLPRKCCAAVEHSNIPALIDLCGESDMLLAFKVHVEAYPVHAVRCTSDIAIVKPVVREHAADLLTKDENPTPAWKHEVKLAKDKKDKEDAAEG